MALIYWIGGLLINKYLGLIETAFSQTKLNLFR